MKIKSISICLFIAFILASCLPAANVAPTGTALPTLTLPPAMIPTAFSVPTYEYLPTITPVPSSTPFAATPGISQELTSRYSQAKYENAFTVTIKEEKFFVKDYREPVYQVRLNFNNFSQNEIGEVTFHLVTHQSRDYKEIPDINHYVDFEINVLGRNSYPYRYTIPAGESEFAVDMSIYVNENYSQCTDGSLDKPLYLLLFLGALGHTDSPLEVSGDINQRILEIPCKYS